MIKMICRTNVCPYGEIWRPDINNEFMIWSGFWRKTEDHFEKFSKFSSIHKFAKGVGLIGKAWEQKTMLLMEDVSKSNDFLRPEITSISELNMAISIPILNHDKCSAFFVSF